MAKNAWDFHNNPTAEKYSNFDFDKIFTHFMPIEDKPDVMKVLGQFQAKKPGSDEYLLSGLSVELDEGDYSDSEVFHSPASTSRYQGGNRPTTIYIHHNPQNGRDFALYPLLGDRRCPVADQSPYGKAEEKEDGDLDSDDDEDSGRVPLDTWDSNKMYTFGALLLHEMLWV